MDPQHRYNLTGRLTDRAVDFIRHNTARRDARPFLLWVNYQDPHPAYTCPPPYDRLFDPAQVRLPETWFQRDFGGEPHRNETWRRHSRMELCTEADARKAIATYMGQVRYVDDATGRIVAALHEGAAWDRTLVLFFSDHGELLFERRMTHKLPAFYECLTRIPVILAHPERRGGGGPDWRARVLPGLVEEVDLAPTLLECLGLPVPPTMVGRSLVQTLDAGRDEFRESVLVEAGGGAPTPEPVPGLTLKAPFAPTSFGPGAMVRRGPWKLSLYADDTPELFNLDEDPHEARNRYENPAARAIREELTSLLVQRLLSVKTRDVGVRWPGPGKDPRFEPLETPPA
jgi:arylsulfatase A-like enzyme